MGFPTLRCCLAGLAGLPGLAHAQIDPFTGFGSSTGAAAGEPALSFLRLPVSARALALGGRELTTGDGAAALCAFPAGLGAVRDPSYALTHSEVLDEFRHEDLSLALPLWRGALGVNATGLFTGVFQDARDIDENPTQPSASDILAGLGYGAAFAGGALDAGSRIDLFRSGIAGASAYGYAVTFAGLFNLGDDYRLGLALNRLSSGVRYSDPGSPLESVPASWSAEIGRPLSSRFFSWQAGYEQGNDGIGQYYGGLELRVLDALTLRAGYDGSLQDRELATESGISAGVGFSWANLSLDYGVKDLLPLGLIHALTLEYARRATPDFDRDRLDRAQEKYRAGRYAAALRLCREAVAANPYNYQAQAFCGQIERDMQRLSERSVTLLYTGNTLGALSPVWINGQSMGGLARRQTKLRELLAAIPRSMVVDAGAWLGPLVSPEHDALLFQAYRRLPYQAVNFNPGDARDSTVAGHGLPWVGGRGSGSGIAANRDIEVGGIRIRVYGYTEGAETPALLAQSLQTDKVDGAHLSLRVLLMRGDLSGARDVARLAPELDAILLSGETEPLPTPYQVDSTLILCPGVLGTQLGELTFVFGPDGRRGGWSHRLLPLDAQVVPDSEMEKLLAPFLTDLNAELGDPGLDDYHAPLVAAVVRQAGAFARIILIDGAVSKSVEITAPGLSASAPVLGYGRNQVAFAGEDSTGRREFYLAQPGHPGLDTLTHFGGQGLEIRFILQGRSLLATYRRVDSAHLYHTHLYRLDPWNHGVADLSQNRFGEVAGFAVSPTENRVAFIAGVPGRDTLWLAGFDLASPLPLAEAASFLGKPAWSGDGKRLAYLVCKAPGDSEGIVKAIDFDHGPLPITAVQARSLAFSEDGSFLVLSSGINLLDLQELRLDSMTLRRLPQAAIPESREYPRCKQWNGRAGVLFESVLGGHRSLRFLDPITGEETPMLENEGDQTLE